MGFFPTVESFLGRGSYRNPEAVVLGQPGLPAGSSCEGEEAMGGLRFAETSLQPGQRASYTILIGATEDETEIPALIHRFGSRFAVYTEARLLENAWHKKVNIAIHTGDRDWDNNMRWICLQPFLRRIYGCSFLPHHDYGRGGRGWRDLWQDCLALLIMDPTEVRQMITDSFGGVRMDGTNATIIGSKPGEFLADRNGIPRVWMDHGMWPFLTTQLYIEQTGDTGILDQEVGYFKDHLVARGRKQDASWSVEQGYHQKTKDGEAYQGSILEHLLLQQLGAFADLGEHGMMLLRGADWNDAIDMASHRGESVAFTAAYVGTLRDLADLLLYRRDTENLQTVSILQELAEYLASGDWEGYESLVRETVSGRKTEVEVTALAYYLKKKAGDMMVRIQGQEWVEDEQGHGWFNSYYDDQGRQVEGSKDGQVRMMLTGQVFTIMSGVAERDRVKAITEAADTYLYEASCGGYRLNTNFREEKYDMGRMFGFAYGEKENGAVFSHMTVMYANALYQRGYAREGYKALSTLTDACLNTEVSRIYPGIPEYFNAKGKGMYHYLTGAASWYALTMVTLVFGVRGAKGRLCISPMLVREQFDEEGCAEIACIFRGRALRVRYENPKKLDYGEYQIVSYRIGQGSPEQAAEQELLFDVGRLPQREDESLLIEIELGERKK